MRMLPVAVGGALGLVMVTTSTVAADKPPIVIGFAIAQSGFMVAYDGGAAQAALLAIEDINAKGGVLGRQLKAIYSDAKSDRAQGARAGMDVVDQGADLVVVSCDYDYGAPAALAAENAGKVSFFLCAEDAKAGIDGVGPHSFTASVAAPVQGAVMAEWGHKEKGWRTVYVLRDEEFEYSKSVCHGFEWRWPRLEGAKILGYDTFRNSDPTVAAQITRIHRLPEKPEVIFTCTSVPGGASVVRQIRAAGIDTPIMSDMAMDGDYWLDAVANLKEFYLPAQGSIYGDDPDPRVEDFNKRFKERYGARPPSSYTYPGYVLIELYAKAVERAGTTDAAKVVAALEKFDDEPTTFGPRSFSPELHIQNQMRYVIMKVEDGKPQALGYWTLSEPLPRKVLFRQ